MAVAEDILNDPYFADLDIDLSQFSEQEKSVIIGVMQKAKDDDKYRKPTEGQLSKWTNLMKGWQFRWFTLDPESGVLEYYVDKEKKKLGPRGSVYLGGSIISPSDEDSFTFTVSAANGDIFKLRASDAKERQDWINKLRSVAEFHASSIGQAAPPLYRTSSFSVPTPQPSPMVKQPASVALATGPSGTVTAENMTCDSPKPQRKLVQVSENVLSGLTQVREDLYRIEDNQMTFIDQLELDPTGEESLLPLASDVLILKATAQAALGSLHHCFSILQGQAADLHTEMPGQDWRPQNGNTEVESETASYAMNRRRLLSFKSQNDRPTGESRHLASGKSVSTPKSQRPTETTENSTVPFCEKARVEMQYNIGPTEEEPDEEAYCAGEEPENQSVEEHKSVILHLLSQLKLGMDLTKVVLPTFILEPRSLLEMYADFLAHPDLFARIPDGLTAEDRMLAVLEFYLTSFHAGRKGALAKKPYNPILGETFRCSWQVASSLNPLNSTTDNSSESSTTATDHRKVTFVAEQVSHHPPISGFYAECPSKKICFNVHIWTKSKFYGMSIGVVNHGEGVISLLEHNEDYVITFPSTYCRSILTFPWVELGGKVNITCSKTGYTASVTFHTKPFYGGKLHRVTGEVKNISTGRVICKINGEWNSTMEFSFTSNQEEPKILDTRKLPVFCKRVCPQSQQEECESRRVWQKVTQALKADNIEAATSAKHEIEEKQRKEARERKEAGTEWKTKLFHRHGSGWRYNYHMKQTVQTSDSKISTSASETTDR
ncbi:oxysterol-binding protein-related protein 11-like isoform X2 [Acropora millepora]|uniref:oxysterol-binding protein-related protein 11-like isoform X2 n=1 Tax=Acropora millepora TaxID=45264 RepID=UPI001CF5661D|nr:oxysterol-binding protein-related protein 11-like isoform X2 [Acropora millepora]